MSPEARLVWRDFAPADSTDACTGNASGCTLRVGSTAQRAIVREIELLADRHSGRTLLTGWQGLSCLVVTPFDFMRLYSQTWVDMERCRPERGKDADSALSTPLPQVQEAPHRYNGNVI